MKNLRPILNVNRLTNQRAEVEILDRIVDHDEYLWETSYFHYDGEGKPAIVSGVAFRDQVKALGEIAEIHVIINSIGGDVTNGLVIYETLKQHPAKVIVDIIGEAASTAGFIAMAGDVINISDGGMMMIHDPMTFTYGNLKDHEDSIKALKVGRQAIINIFRNRTSKSEKQISDWMADETWFDSKQAKDAGLVDNILEKKAIYNSSKIQVASSQFRNYPKSIESPKTFPSLIDAEFDSLNLRRRQLQVS